MPIRPVIGNHDVFGIDRRWSRAAVGDPGYGKALYEEKEGPRYSAFNRGQVHFLVLDTIGVDDRATTACSTRPSSNGSARSCATCPRGRRW